MMAERAVHGPKIAPCRAWPGPCMGARHGLNKPATLSPAGPQAERTPRTRTRTRRTENGPWGCIKPADMSASAHAALPASGSLCCSSFLLLFVFCWLSCSPPWPPSTLHLHLIWLSALLAAYTACPWSRLTAPAVGAVVLFYIHGPPAAVLCLAVALEVIMLLWACAVSVSCAGSGPGSRLLSPFPLRVCVPLLLYGFAFAFAP